MKQMTNGMVAGRGFFPGKGGRRGFPLIGDEFGYFPHDKPYGHDFGYPGPGGGFPPGPPDGFFPPPPPGAHPMGGFMGGMDTPLPMGMNGGGGPPPPPPGAMRGGGGMPMGPPSGEFPGSGNPGDFGGGGGPGSGGDMGPNNSSPSLNEDEFSGKN